MKGFLKEKVYPHFAKVLESQGYVKTEDHYSEKHMGDEVMSFESKHVIIRFYTDRGDLYSEIGAPPGKKFHGLERFMEFMGYLKNHEYGSATPAQLGQLLAEHHDEIRNFFADYPNRAPKLLAWEDEGRKKWIEQLRRSAGSS